MAEDVFISYSHENKDAARILADMIVAKGYGVWWDHELVAGDSYSDVIESKLDAAKAVIVIWSETSRKSHWVRDEAAVGRDRNRLLPVSIDSNPPPLGFRQIQTIDLQGWDGRDPGRLASLFRGLVGLMNVAPRAQTAGGQAAGTNPFGGPVVAAEETKGGKLAAGVNAAPNNKPLKQILHEEKKQRSFFRTYWLTSFICSAIIAAIAGVMLPSLSSSDANASVAAQNPLVAHAGNTIAMFMVVGFGLFIGRALIILGRRLSKRKSIRYFDSTTLIVLALTIVESAAIAIVTTIMPDQAGSVHYSAAENITYSFVVGVAVIFPMMAFLSVLIGFFRGLGRTSYADGA